MPVAHIRAHPNDRRIHTTLGELIATISDVAFEYAADTEEAYEIARLVLVKILKDASLTRKVAGVLEPKFAKN
ncbi:MAG: hypothetical protein ACREQ2_22245 [Candidatus Binatia bacterium]